MLGGKVYDVALTNGTARIPSVDITATLPAAAVATLTFTEVSPRIRISGTAASGSNLPSGLAYSVRVTSSAYAGGFQDFACQTGSNCDITINTTDTYNVSLSRRIESGAQRWFVASTCAADVITIDVTAATGGTVSSTGGCIGATANQDRAGTVQVAGFAVTATATTVAHHLKSIAITWVGPVPTP